MTFPVVRKALARACGAASEVLSGRSAASNTGNHPLLKAFLPTIRLSLGEALVSKKREPGPEKKKKKYRKSPTFPSSEATINSLS
jgi:hypothetical protein